MPEEIKPEVIQKTQKILGKYVKKPQLSEKLLKKPPFRFLHDIVNVVIKETGFLKGLFSDDELNSENVKERDAKIAFLTKLIEAIKSITSTELAVRPSKIIAGLEPTETNLLLQAIARAIDKNIDSSQYVKTIKSSTNHVIEEKKKSKKVDKDEKLKKPSKTDIKNDDKTKSRTKIKENNTPKSTDRDKKRTGVRTTTNESSTKKNNLKTKETKKSPKTDTIAEEIKKDEIAIITEENKINEQSSVPTILEESSLNSTNVTEQIPPSDSIVLPPSSNNIESTNQSEVPSVTPTIEKEERKRTPSASRPKSARPRSGDRLKETNDDIPQDEPLPIPITTKPLARPKSSLRPPSVRPSSARPGAPRLRPDSALPMKEVIPLGKINVIVENFDKDTDDNEETLVIQSSPDLPDRQLEELEKIPEDNKGHLVEQILEQIEGENESYKSKIDIEQEGFQNKDMSKETNNLKSMIQSLTKTANPLGKLLSYLHEDIDAMQNELETWTATKKQLFAEISKQKKISAELNKPLLAQLNNLNQEIRRMEEDIANARNNILKNDLKIKKLLSK